MVMKDLDKSHKQVQLAHASLLSNYAVLFKGQQVPDRFVCVLLSVFISVFASFPL